MSAEHGREESVVAFVMAGGQGSRLSPLTAERCKPAVPFGARYRIVDFVLSNLINSNIRSIYLLVQYKAQALIEHIRKAYVFSPLLPDQFITVVPPQMHEDSHLFKGTADAVYQSLRLIEMHQPDIVAVFGADHVYRMDVRQMIRFHREHNADVTLAALPVALNAASDFGILGTDKEGRVTEFQEKPEHAKPMPTDPAYAYASMGNYIFSTDVLVRALDECRTDETDFGHHVLPRMLNSHRLFAYNLAHNKVPGVKAYEDASYWRDVGSIDAYFDAHKDVMGDQPKFDAFNPQWPIFSSNYQGPVARILGGEIEDSLFGAATLVHKGAKVRNCIIRREAVIEEGAELDDCIIMDYARIGRGARLKRVIVDRHNMIAPGDCIGYNSEEDAKRYHVTASGIVVVPEGKVTYFARDTRDHGPGYAE